MSTTRFIPRRPFSSAVRVLQQESSRSASAHLFQQADKEEQLREEGRPQGRESSVPDKDAWTGEERVQDAVLRMLIDSYKPLRVEGWKPKREIQQPTERLIEEITASTSHQKQPESSDVHRYPWDFTYKAPAHYAALGGVRPQKKSARRPGVAGRAGTAARLEKAIEDRADRAAGHDKHKEHQPRQPILGPASAFSNLVEERIQRAQAEGFFKNIQGRGKPMKRDENDSNPYISSRTDFLLNRLIERNNACPPWIDLQQQLEAQLTTFRQTLRGDWARRAVRMITLPGLHRLEKPGSLEREVKIFRDPEWETRERGFHEESLKSINSLTRSYNALAPPSVRRALYSLDTELEGCFRESVPVIEYEIRRRLEDPHSGKEMDGIPKNFIKQQSQWERPEDQAQRISMWQAFKQLVKERSWKQT